MIEDIVPAVVIDNGSGFCKVGISGDDVPRAAVATAIGKPKQPGQMVGMDQKDTYIGDEVFSQQNKLNITYPVDHGIINNWTDMEKLWHHCFHNELRLAPEDHNVLMTEAPNLDKKKREKMMEIMFEQFNVPAFYLAIQQVLALFASGRTTGIVVDSGYAVTHSVPIYEGFALSHAIQKMNLSGRELTEYLIQLVSQDGKKFGNNEDQIGDYARDTKEKKCYVIGDFEAEMKIYSETNKQEVHKLPDGTEISLGAQLFKCPEALFSPLKLSQLNKNLQSSNLTGIHELTFQSIMKCDVDIRKDLYGNIIMAGGSTMFKGISDRLQKEVVALAPSTMKIKVWAPPERKYSVWMGGSILSHLSSFQPMFITKSEWTEAGNPNIIHKRCF